jgi:acetoacetate decarboxylase
MTSQFEGTHLSSSTAPYPMPPLTYEKNRMLAIMFRTSIDVLRDLVPEPLVVNPYGQMIIYIGALNVVSPVRVGYLEAGIMIPASDGREEGVYLPVLYLDKALPIVVGREVWGFPKFQADLSLQEEAGVVHARVVSEKTTLMDAVLHMGAPIPPPVLSPGTFFLMKRIPSVTGPSLFDVKQLVTAVLRDENQQEVRPGDATLRLGSTATDPLERIPVIDIIQGVYCTGGFVLDYGRIVYDYLANG